MICLVYICFMKTMQKIGFILLLVLTSSISSCTKFSIKNNHKVDSDQQIDKTLVAKDTGKNNSVSALEMKFKGCKAHQ